MMTLTAKISRLGRRTATLTACLLFAVPLQAQNLFTSAAEREYLDFLREEYLRNNQAADFNIAETIPEIPVIEVEEENTGPDFYSLGGIITQRDGSRMIWLNNLAVNERDLPQNMRLISTGSAQALRISLDEGNFDLRPGQTLDVRNARIRDAFDTPMSSSQNNVPVSDSSASENNQPPPTPTEQPTAPAQTAETAPAPATAQNVSSADELRDALRLGIDQASEEELAELMILLQEAGNAQ